jgi:hypothetical protein
MKTNRLTPGKDGGQEEPGMIGEQNDHCVKGCFLQRLQEDIRHMRSHAVGGSKDANATPSFIGPVGQIFLHPSDLIDFKRLSLGFDHEDVRMQMAIDLLTGKAMIAGLPLLYLPFGAVEGLCKLESDPLLSNSLIPQEQITVDHFIVLNRPPEQFISYVPIVFKRRIFQKGFENRGPGFMQLKTCVVIQQIISS